MRGARHSWLLLRYSGSSRSHVFPLEFCGLYKARRFLKMANNRSLAQWPSITSTSRGLVQISTARDRLHAAATGPPPVAHMNGHRVSKPFPRAVDEIDDRATVEAERKTAVPALSDLYGEKRALVRLGSQAEELTVSKCFPLLPQQRKPTGLSETSPVGHFQTPSDLTG
jgi:hypothetical protein